MEIFTKSFLETFKPIIFIYEKTNNVGKRAGGLQKNKREKTSQKKEKAHQEAETDKKRHN